MNSVKSKSRFQEFWRAAGVLVCCAAAAPSVAFAQGNSVTNPPPASSISSQLGDQAGKSQSRQNATQSSDAKRQYDDLLDLIQDEPAPGSGRGSSSSPMQTPAQSGLGNSGLGNSGLGNSGLRDSANGAQRGGNQREGMGPALRPEDVGLDGEDLGEQSENPLAAVRQSMLIAAGFLQRGSAGDATQTVQRDVLIRLDELISELEQPQPQNRQQTESQSQQQEDSQAGQQETVSQPSGSQNDGPPEQRSGERQGSSGDGDPTASNRPGIEGSATSAVVELADPRALQQDVWGHLPERVRKQMQSRMVEQFLPSYRERIEAYYRALLEDSTSNSRR